MTRRSDDRGDDDAGDATGAATGRVDARFDPAFQRGAPTGPLSADRRRDPRVEPHAGPSFASWLAPVLWILAVAFPAAGLALRAAAVGITGSMPYSSFGEPLGQRWLLELAPLLTTLAPGIVAGGPVAVVAALAVHAVRRSPRRPSA